MVRNMTVEDYTNHIRRKRQIGTTRARNMASEVFQRFYPSREVPSDLVFMVNDAIRALKRTSVTVTDDRLADMVKSMFGAGAWARVRSHIISAEARRQQAVRKVA